MAGLVNQLQRPNPTGRIKNLVFDIPRLVMFGSAIFGPAIGACLAIGLHSVAELSQHPITGQWMVTPINNGNIHIEI